MTDPHGEECDLEEIAFLRSEVKRLRAALSRHTPGLETILKRRGFYIHKKNSGEGLLVPEPRFVDEYYRRLHKYSFRLFLRDVIKQKKPFRVEDVSRYATTDATSDFLRYMKDIGLVREEAGAYFPVRQVRSFGETLEWFISEIFEREFSAEAFWGVQFKRRGVGGDYDVIAKYDGHIFYVEAKSSPPRQVAESEISGFLGRTFDLKPELSIFLMDTELRMKDKIEPMFRTEYEKRGLDVSGIRRMKKELFRISDGIYIINTGDGLTSNLEYVINRHFRR